MTKKLNGYAQWTVILIAVGAIVFNTGITYQKIIGIEKELRELKNMFWKFIFKENDNEKVFLDNDAVSNDWMYSYHTASPDAYE